jgi:hypothetical protein
MLGSRLVNLIYIWVRRTLDWNDEAVAFAGLEERLKPKVQTWNETFTMTYQRFRWRVSQIADLSHSAVEGAVRADWDDIPDGAVVLPVDDDDWFAPETAHVLERELTPPMSGLVWPACWIQVPRDARHRRHLIRKRLLPFTTTDLTCSTNNYAVVRSADGKTLATSHVKASRWFDGQLEQPDATIRRIDGRLSVANRNLSSQSSLGGRGPMIDEPALLDKFRRYQRLYRRAPRRDIAWCSPYLQLMDELMAELHVREDRGRPG